MIDSLGNKEILKINDLKNPDKEIYDYCLLKKYDYKKVKELKTQFNQKYKIIYELKVKGNKITWISGKAFGLIDYPNLY